MITYDDFKKVEIRAGKILSAEKVEKADKLLRLTVDFAEKKEVKKEITKEDGTVETLTEMVDMPRQIVSGISMYFPDPAVLVGKTCMFVTNLEPRVIRGLESNGMLFAISTPEGDFSLLEPNGSIPPGTQAA
jgi:tRNA-binding EMAP/Myf-like protein